MVVDVSIHTRRLDIGRDTTVVSHVLKTNIRLLDDLQKAARNELILFE